VASDTTNLISAAAAVLEEAGPDGLTVRAIATKAGCSTMVVYSQFGGKNGVVDALYIDGFQRLAREIQATMPTDDPVADLRRCAQRYRKFALENRQYYAIMFEGAIDGFTRSDAASMTASDTLGILSAKIQRAIDARQLPEHEARDVAACLWAVTHGVVSLELKHVGPPDIDWRRRHVQVIDAVLDGFRNALKPA
jgi:AcrR family transcriptional regulator